MEGWKEEFSPWYLPSLCNAAVFLTAGVWPISPCHSLHLAHDVAHQPRTQSGHFSLFLFPLTSQPFP